MERKIDAAQTTSRPKAYRKAPRYRHTSATKLMTYRLVYVREYAYASPRSALAKLTHHPLVTQTDRGYNPPDQTCFDARQ